MLNAKSLFVSDKKWSLSALTNKVTFKCGVIATRGSLLWLQANDKGADKHSHAHSLISAFVIRSQGCMIARLATGGVSVILVFSLAEQTTLSRGPYFKGSIPAVDFQ